MAWAVLRGSIAKLAAELRGVQQGVQRVVYQLPGPQFRQMSASSWVFSAASPRATPRCGSHAHTQHSSDRPPVPFTGPKPCSLLSCASSPYSCGQFSGARSRVLWMSCATLDQRQLHTHSSTNHRGNPLHKNSLLYAPGHIPRTLCHTVPAQQPQRLNSDFLVDGQPPSSPLYLLLLNYHLPRPMIRLWKKASYKVCADGGANQLHDHLKDFMEGDEEQLRRSFWPDAIVGDLDSIRDDVQQYYQSGGSLVKDLSADQDSTDACKCLMHLEQHVIPPGQHHTILMCGALGGRLDHTLANLHSLHKFAHLNVVLLGDGNMARLIRPGRTSIQLAPPDTEGPRCGLVPLLQPALVTTSGLKWNVDAAQLSMGGLISTSNVVAGTGEVTIETNSPLVWMTEVPEERGHQQR